MGGVQRTAKFVKYLCKFGWEPIVITSTPKIYYAFDFNLLEELNHIHIIRTGGDIEKINSTKEIKFSDESFRKILSKLGQIFLIPDTKVFWKKDAIKCAESIIKGNNIDLIFSTAPPYTDFLVGYEISKKYNIPLVLDYRDDWIQCPYNFYLTPFHRKFHIKLERKILNHSNAFITINYKIQNLIFDRYPEIDFKNSEVIPQGYDPEDLSKAKEISDKILAEKKRMRFCYSGSFFNLMTPEYFLKSLRVAFDREPEMKSQVEAYFVGIFPDKFIPLIKNLDLEENIVTTGYISHIESMAHLIAADVLWMMIGRSKKSFMISTGKLFEYIGTGKPILACIPAGTAKDALSGYGAEIFTDPDDVNEIAKKIILLFNQYKQGKLPTANKEFISRYNREILTKKLASIFNKIIS